jgi:hypothetical protein
LHGELTGWHGLSEGLPVILLCDGLTRQIADKISHPLPDISRWIADHLAKVAAESLPTLIALVCTLPEASAVLRCLFARDKATRAGLVSGDKVARVTRLRCLLLPLRAHALDFTSQTACGFRVARRMGIAQRCL